MRRRRFLSVLGSTAAALPVAGCTTRDRTEPATSGRTTSPTAASTPRVQNLSVGETASDLNGASLSVSAPTVQGSIIISTAGSYSVNRRDSYQYVVFEVQGPADVEPTDFVIKRDGQLRAPPVQRHFVKPVTRQCSATCLGLPIETHPTDSAAVVYRPADRVRAAWKLEAETVSVFEVQPRCLLQAVHLTDQDGQLGVRVTARNPTNRSAGFRALIAPAWLSDGAAPVGFSVPATATVTETFVPQNLQKLSTENATVISDITEETRYIKIGRD